MNINSLITESLARNDITHILTFNTKVLNKTEAKWFAWIRGYLDKFGVPPTIDRFAQEFSTSFMPESNASPLEDIAESAFVAKRNEYTRALLSKHADDLRNGADPYDLIKSLYEDTQQTDGSVLVSGRWDKGTYFNIPKSTETGIEAIDNVTGGVVNGDLWFIAGRPNDGKTTLLLHMIARWYWKGKKILVISNEIPHKDMLFKIDCILSGVQPKEKRTGNWGPDSKLKIEMLSYIERHLATGEIIMAKKPVIKPAHLSAMIQSTQPDIIAIDGAYFMSNTGRPTSDWSELASVSRELKQIANRHERPIIGVLQANRDSEFRSDVSLAAIAGTDGFGQDADIVLLLRKNGLINGADRATLCHAVKNRHGEANAVAGIAYDFARMNMYEYVDES